MKGKSGVIKPPPPRRSQRNKRKKDAEEARPNVTSAWVQKVNEVKTAFPLAEEGCRRVSVRGKLKERHMLAATKKTKAALALNKAKESRQATIAAKRRKVIKKLVVRCIYSTYNKMFCLRESHGWR